MDSNGCVGVVNMSMLINLLLILVIVGDLDFCFEGNIILSIIENYVFYSWSMGSILDFMLVDIDELVSLIVIDVNQCIVIIIVQFVFYEVMIFNIMGDLDFCVGESMLFIVIAGYVSYIWFDG